MSVFNDQQNARIEKQSLPALKNAFALACDMEVDLEQRLKLIREVKARILIEVDIRINNKNPQ